VPILRRYSPDSLVRVPPHVTVLYPFVPVRDLAGACEKVRAICADLPGFDLHLQGYDHFPLVAFMNPIPPEPIKALFGKSHAAFPECQPYYGQYGNDIHAHLTVAEFATEAEQAVAALPDYAPMTFRASRLHVMVGPAKLPLPWIAEA